VCENKENSRLMKFETQIAPRLVLAGWLVILSSSLSANEDKSVEFQGTLSAVDLAAKTITVRARHKEFVFQIDLQRCNIVKDGLYPFIPGAQSPALASARVGDAVVGKLVVENNLPVVTRLYLTSKPEPAVRVKEKPGFVTSPYHFTSPLSHLTVGHSAIDVRGYQRGSMLVDETSGKIFLVP
jgi:hypothetical protein